MSTIGRSLGAGGMYPLGAEANSFSMMGQPTRGESALIEGGGNRRASTLSLTFQDCFKPKNRGFKETLKDMKL